MTDADHTLRTREESIAAVILAAGAGSRFDGDDHKLLAEISGAPIIVHVIEAARRADVDEVIVVQGSVDLSAHVPDDVTLLANEQWAEGQATSLRAAVAYAQARCHDAIVVGLGDSPGVTAEIWDRVAHVDADLASARYDGDLRPPVRLAASIWPSLPVSGDEGARAVMRQRPDLVRPVPVDGDPRDIDTLQDLRRWS
ncbi:MAG: nucleotidyltransferase family protein [Actinomycetota bacterium]